MPSITSPPLQAAAIDYHNRGWCVIPLLGKSPRVLWIEYQSTRPTREQVEAWWQQWPDAGIGVVLGEVSGLFRVDADGEEAAEKARALIGDQPTVEFVTPNQGRGWLFKYEPNTCESREVLWPGNGDHQELVVMSGGTFTVVPPSPHPDGGMYEWVNSPWGAAPEPIPIHLKDAIRSNRAGRALRDLELELRGTIEQPDRELLLEALAHLSPEYALHYETWTQVGMALHSVDESLLDIWEEWSKQCPEKYEEGACERKWRTFTKSGGVSGRSILHWAKANGWKPPTREDMELTDTGNAHRFVKHVGENVRYCHTWKKWLIWNDKQWAEDNIQHMRKLVRATTSALLDDAKTEYAKAVDSAQRSDANDAQGKKKRASRLYAWAMESRSAAKERAALEQAQSMVPIIPKQFDQHPWLFNCPNGTLDLRSGELREHRREDYLTMVCPTEYHADAECPRWRQFLGEIFPGSENLVAWIQRLFGRCLTGDVSEQILPIFWGDGANGKRTLLGTVMSVMGTDYADKASRDLLLSNKKDGHPTLLATLFGKRFVAAIETGANGELDEVMVKELTGGERISCRRMHEDYWTFAPTHKLILATNHKPIVKGTDHAIWRRLKLVPFLVKFDGDQRDRELPEKLLAEAPGILRWMVEGCAAWRRHGLGEPTEVEAATQEYRSDQDLVGEFLSSKCQLRPDVKERAKSLLEAYATWCAEEKVKRLETRELGSYLQRHGITRGRGEQYYNGVILRSST